MPKRIPRTRTRSLGARAAVTALLASLWAWPAFGQAVGEEFQVNTYTTGLQQYPKVAPVGGGGFVVVWQSDYQDGYGWSIFGQRYDATGVPSGDEFQVSTYTNEYQYYPSVASDGSGGFVVVWQSYGQEGTYSEGGVFGRRFDSAGGTRGDEFQVNTYTNDYQYYPSVASDASGNFVVVWQSYGQDGSDYGIFGQRYDGTGRVGDEFQVNSYTTYGQNLPKVASTGSGSFVVVWQSYDPVNSDFEVFGQRYDSTGKWSGAEFQVNTYTPDVQYYPSVASDGSGGFVVVWESYGQDGDSFGVFGRRFGAEGSTPGDEFQVNTHTADDQYYPFVAYDESGGFAVVWESYGQDGDGFGVFGQRYDNTGSRLGTEIQLNAFTTGDQGNSSIASDGSGGFVVVWESDDQDGSFSGIFARHFVPEPRVTLLQFSALAALGLLSALRARGPLRQ